MVREAHGGCKTPHQSEGETIGLTRRLDSFYVEFRVIESEDGKSLVLAPGVPDARKKRWKVGYLNKTVAREMEAAVKTRLLLGQAKTEQAKPTLFKEWAKVYLDLEEVTTLRSQDTKTSETRHVPMTPDIRLTLQRMLKERRDLSIRHVFTFRGKPLLRVSRSFRTALKDAGIEDLRFHDLRHCAATNLRRGGVDTATAMKIVGHKSEKMWKRYNAIEEKDLQKAVLKVQQYLDSNAEDGSPRTLGEH